MRFFYLITLLGLSFAAQAQDLEELLEHHVRQPWHGPVVAVEERIEPGNEHHRIRTILYTFDRDHRLAERLFKAERWTFRYDGSGRLVRKERYYGEELQEYMELDYRPGGWVERTFGARSGECVKRCEVRRDSLGRPVWVSKSWPASGAVSLQQAYFDEDEVLIRSSRNGQSIRDRVYPYQGGIHLVARVVDAEGRLQQALEKPLRTSDELVLWEHKYEYDEYGNWIRRETTRIRGGREKLLYRVTRRIEYASGSGI